MGFFLALLAANLEAGGAPLRTAAIGCGRAAVPSAGAGDRLRLMFVLVDDVLEGLDGGGLDRWATVHTDSCGRAMPPGGSGRDSNHTRFRRFRARPRVAG